ncbi:hypothetical protein [Xenorhabdus stockiae]|uniref:hypothetical protein n=1 Tax=Xenorhabdus stockiae TaxID=351614 RepID=UPI004063F08A
MDKKEENTNFYEKPSLISISMKCDSNVFNNQVVYLVVKVIFDIKILRKIINFQMESEPDSIQVRSNYDYSIVNSDGRSYGFSSFLLYIKNHTNESKVKFAVKEIDHYYNAISEIMPLSVVYNVLQIKPQNMIPLRTKNEFMSMPENDNPINNIKRKYNLYIGKVVDNNGFPINNIQVMVSAEKFGLLDILPMNITTDPEKENTPALIKIKKIGSMKFFPIQSDKNGNIRFRVYPIKNIETRIDFSTQIYNVISEEPAASIYI